MPLAVIGDVTVDLPIKFREGMELDSDGAWALNEIMLIRVRERIRWRLRSGQIDPSEAQDVVIEMVESFTYEKDEPCDADDSVMEEAVAIATELIVKALAKDGMIPPKNLEEHAKMLAQQSDEIKKRARARIEARYNTAREALLALGD